MKALALACACALVCALHSANGRAAQPKRDAKVCVRIEEKTWTREGVATPGRSEKKAPHEEARTEKPPAEEAAPVPQGDAAEPTIPEQPAPDPSAETAPTSAQFAAAGKPASVAPSPDGAADAAPPVDDATGSASESTPPSPVEADGQGKKDQDDHLVASEEADFFAVDPKLYLRRLIEYHVTHEPGFEAVRRGCTQTLRVELYPVRHGWTVFARYTGSAREEKVDVVRLDELDTFAERVTIALLRDKSIAETLTRTTVLRSDSETRVRQIKTRTHLLIAMGSALRVGRLPTAPNTTAPAEKRLRLETPLSFSIGVRNKFRAWALDAAFGFMGGLTERASRRNAGGGHVDYSAGVGVGLGFLAFAEPDAVNTLYYGGGAGFELSRYQTIAPVEAGGHQDEPGGLWGGGLNVNAIVGYEFMRTSTLHFFVQGKLVAPAYVFESENDQSRIHSYIPSGNVEVGLLF